MIAGSLTRIATAGCLCVLLAACASDGRIGLYSADLAYGRATAPSFPSVDPSLYPDDTASSAPATIDTGPRLECVPYAREHSGVNIHGDAYTWWDKAAGVYYRGSEPVMGAVMLMVGYAGKHRAHVAVVRRMVSPREIRIDHANWLNDGAIYVNDPVMDVSEDNDWSQVKVWNIRSGSWGTKIYNVKGFIGPGTSDENPVVASSDFNAVVASWDDPIARQIAAAPTVSAMAVSSTSTNDASDELLGDGGVDR